MEAGPPGKSWGNALHCRMWQSSTTSLNTQSVTSLKWYQVSKLAHERVWGERTSLSTVVTNWQNQCLLSKSQMFLLIFTTFTDCPSIDCNATDPTDIQSHNIPALAPPLLAVTLLGLCHPRYTTLFQHSGSV